MSNSTPLTPDKPCTTYDSAEAHSQGVADSIKALLKLLPPQERERVLREITETLRPFPAAKAEKVMGTIVRLFPRDKSWTVEELKEKIAESGIDARPKEVYNAVGYLARKGHIHRIGYGRYIIDGVEIITPDDLGGPSSRHEDGYRLDWEQKEEEI